MFIFGPLKFRCLEATIMMRSIVTISITICCHQREKQLTIVLLQSTNYRV